MANESMHAIFLYIQALFVPAQLMKTAQHTREISSVARYIPGLYSMCAFSQPGRPVPPFVTMKFIQL